MRGERRRKARTFAAGACRNDMGIEVRVVWGDTVVHVATVGRFGTFEPVVKRGKLTTGDGTFARLEGGNGVAYEARVVEPVDFATPVEHAPLLTSALSALVHAGLLAAFALATPMFADPGAAHRDRLLTMQRLLAHADEPGEQVAHLDDDMRDASGVTEGGTGVVSAGAAGRMGSREAARVNAQFGIRGWADNPRPESSRASMLEEAETFGMVGVVGTAPASLVATPWGGRPLGNEAKNAAGNLWGDQIGDAYGTAGLSLSGTGLGGGGRGEGVGVGRVGTIGHGLGHGIGGGVGAGHGHLEGGHTPGPPFRRDGSTTVSGRLPPETIQRVVRASFGRFRGCYAEALDRNPTLEGRVVVKFVIDRDGSVSTSADAGSDMTAPVTDCVVRRFGDLSFPPPTGGVVTVVYPLVLTPT
jgi:hypothetical protein